MRPVLVVLAFSIATSLGVAWGQFDGEKKAKSEGIRFGEEQKQRWRVGIVIGSAGAKCQGIYGTAPVPTDWPEQKVRKVEEEITPQVGEVKYRTLENGVKQMLIRIPTIEAGETAKALVTFEVQKKAILPPENPDQFVEPKDPPRDVRPYLGTSPMIEIRNPKIRSLAKEVVEGKDSAWKKVEAIYDWVREHIEYRNGDLKGALAALRDGYGDCEELTSLFIAFCRVNRIPARTVWIPNHCYPEFYLEDKAGQGHWIPCQVAGTRDFGGMPDFRPILQKGDSFRVPEVKEPQRYAAEYLKVSTLRTAKPDYKFVRELLPAD
jgi:hypothetical protein